MAESTTFRIVTIPKIQSGTEIGDKSTALAEKFRELRLRALKLAPEAFGSTFGEESQRGLDHTIGRLSNPKATHFIALKMSSAASPSFDGHDDMERILKAEWVGSLVLMGPQKDEGKGLDPDRDPFRNMAAAGKEKEMLSDQGELHSPEALHYHLNGMFVDPAARGGGLGLTLINAAMRRAEGEAAKFNASLRVTVNVYAHNVSAHKLYEKGGFKEVVRKPSKSKGPEVIAVDMEMSLAAAP